MADKETLSQSDVNDVVKFTEALYSGLPYKGVYTPFLVNDILKNKTLSPEEGDESKIADAMKTPKTNEQQLLGYVEYQELTNMVFKKTLYYYANLPAYDVAIECTNANGGYNKTQYRADLARVATFFDKFNVVKQFQTITKQMLRQEVYFGSLWETNNRYFFQELPQKYCMITGEWENGLLFDFNMMYFLQPGTDIDGYLPEFKDYYARMLKSDKMYNPTSNAWLRDSSWTYWVQTNASNNWCFKFNSNIAARVPYLSGLLMDSSQQPLMRELQKNINILSASKILTGEIGYKKDGKGAMNTNNYSFDPETIGKFLAVVKAGLNDLIQIAALPLENISGVEYDTKDAVDNYSNYNRTLASLAGNSRLLFSYEKANAIESRYMMNLDENLMRALYAQYENFLNFMVNKDTVTYKFKVTLKGFNSYTDKKDRADAAKYWADKGIIDVDSISHSLGYSNRFSLLRRMEEVQAMGFENMVTMLPNMYTQTGVVGTLSGGSNDNDKKDEKDSEKKRIIKDAHGDDDSGDVSSGGFDNGVKVVAPDPTAPVSKPGTRIRTGTGGKVGRPKKDLGSVSDNGTILNPNSNDNKQA